MADQASPTGLLTGGNAQELGTDQPRRFTASGCTGDGWQRERRDDPESSSAPHNGSGAFEPTVSALDKIMARFDQLEFKLDARDRRVDRLEATRLPEPDQPYFSDDGDVDGYRSQGDVWPTDEDGPPVFNHGRRDRGGDVRRRRGTGRDLNRREAGLAQPGSGTIPYRAHTASWPRTSWDRPAARVTTEFDRGFRGYRQPTSWDPPSTAPPVGILPVTDQYRASSPTTHHGHGSPLVGNHRLTVHRKDTRIMISHHRVCLVVGIHPGDKPITSGSSAAHARAHNLGALKSWGLKKRWWMKNCAMKSN